MSATIFYSLEDVSSLCVILMDDLVDKCDLM